MDPLLSNLLIAIRSTPRPVNEAQIITAWEFADQAHRGQMRLSGDPYITHPTHVATKLALWNLDTTTVVAGLLHDVVEDTPVTRNDLAKKFGEEIAVIVDGVTNITKLRVTGNRQEEFVENLRKMFLVMAKDLRVVIVKFADRIHNLETISFLSPEKQISNSQETLDIYAPLAERLGMGEVKGELEDLSFPIVYPEEFLKLKTEIKPYLTSGEEYIKKFRRRLLSLIIPEISAAQISIRQKHLYSLFKKLQRPEIAGDLTKVHDLFAARILVDTDTQCYQVLGLIHGEFHPVPYLGISDFIATPKPNGYQSLHTKVFGPEGRIVELQIRTHAMHQQAEMGAAAHWSYSEAKSHGASDTQLEKGSVKSNTKLDWVRQIQKWQEEIKDNSEYLQTLKFDALSHRLLVFSPKGDVYDLPIKATPIDYAFQVHTDIGSQVQAAKVNGKLVPLNYQLQNGDVVELVLNRKRKSPNRDWLDFVVTTTARHQISKSVKS